LDEELKMMVRRAWVFLVAGLVAIALAIAGCGNSPSDEGGSSSANPPATEAPGGTSGTGYGY
jgi:hypothetical protein